MYNQKSNIMKPIRLIYLVFTLLIAATIIIGCEKQIQDEIQFPELTNEAEPTLKSTTSCSFDLIADQNITVGTVTSDFNSPTEVTITYLMTDTDWCLIKIHLDVQSDPANFPMNTGGNPQVGNFAYNEMLDCELSWSVTIDLTTISGWASGDAVYIASHAEVKKPPVRSAWAGDTPFPGNSWANYFSCTPPPSWECGDPITDERDGQTYNTVQIGDQCWMAENMNIGTMIYSTSNGSQQTDNDIIEKYCYNNDENNCDIYGGLYEWDEMMQYVTDEGAQGICPEGWHVATDDEWTTLTDYLGGLSVAGGKMKSSGTLEAGTGLWKTPNTGATNESGFTALPAGVRRYYNNGQFYYLGIGSNFWSSSQSSESRAWYIYPYYHNARMQPSNNIKATGGPVRCLKD
jgi:uncharacterized protein (TIGR02145 family)